MVAMAYEQRAAADKVDGVLFELDSDLAGLLEFQRRSITWFGVLGDWRVSGDRSYELPSALQFGAKSLVGCSFVLGVNNSPVLAWAVMMANDSGSSVSGRPSLKRVSK